VERKTVLLREKGVRGDQWGGKNLMTKDGRGEKVKTLFDVRPGAKSRATKNKKCTEGEEDGGGGVGGDEGSAICEKKKRSRLRRVLGGGTSQG